MLAGMSETTNGHDFKALRKAALNLSLLSDDERSSMLMRMADGLDAARERIFEANRADIAASEKKGLSDALMHRLVLNESKLSGALNSVRAVAKLPCPVGRVVEKRLLDEGLVLEKRTYPIGVIGMVFEARPDALIQIVSLAIKSANGIVLKGGSEASRTNETLVDIIRQSIDGAPFMMLLSSHRDVDTMLSMEGDVDLIIPRGSNSFVRYCMEHTHIPVMGHDDGICCVRHVDVAIVRLYDGNGNAADVPLKSGIVEISHGANGYSVNASAVDDKGNNVSFEWDGTISVEVMSAD